MRESVGFFCLLSLKDTERYQYGMLDSFTRHEQK